MHLGYGLKYLNWNKGKYKYPFRCFYAPSSRNSKVETTIIYDWIKEHIGTFAYELIDSRSTYFYFDDKEDIFRLLLRWSPEIELQTFEDWQTMRGKIK